MSTRIITVTCDCGWEQTVYHGDCPLPVGTTDQAMGVTDRAVLNVQSVPDVHIPHCNEKCNGITHYVQA